jgi:histone H1/5
MGIMEGGHQQPPDMLYTIKLRVVVHQTQLAKLPKGTRAFTVKEKNYLLLLQQKKMSTSKVQVTAIPTVKGTSGGRPTYSQMINEALLNLAQRGGSSRVAMCKYILENYGKELSQSAIPVQVRIAVKHGVESGMLVQNRQSYRIASHRRKGIIEGMINGTVTKKKLTEAKKRKSTSGRPAPKVLADKKAAPKVAKAVKAAPKGAKGGKAKSRPLQKTLINLLSEHDSLSRDDLYETLTHFFEVPSSEREMFRRSLMAILTKKRDELWLEDDENNITIKSSARLKAETKKPIVKKAKATKVVTKEKEETASEEEEEPIVKKVVFKGDKPVTKAQAARSRAAAMARAGVVDDDSDSDTE